MAGICSTSVRNRCSACHQLARSGGHGRSRADSSVASRVGLRQLARRRTAVGLAGSRAPACTHRVSASKTRMVTSKAAPTRSRNAITPGVSGSPGRYTATTVAAVLLRPVVAVAGRVHQRPGRAQLGMVSRPAAASTVIGSGSSVASAEGGVVGVAAPRARTRAGRQQVAAWSRQVSARIALGQPVPGILLLELTVRRTPGRGLRASRSARLHPLAEAVGGGAQAPARGRRRPAGRRCTAANSRSPSSCTTCASGSCSARCAPARVERLPQLPQLVLPDRPRHRPRRASRTPPPTPGAAPCARAASPGSTGGTSWKMPLAALLVALDLLPVAAHLAGACRPPSRRTRAGGGGSAWR